MTCTFLLELTEEVSLVAASDKHLKRRQRRQQNKQQLVPPQRQQQPARTPRKQSGSSPAGRVVEIQSPKEQRQTQMRQRSTSQNRPNWLQRLFGQKTKRPTGRIQRRVADEESVFLPRRDSKRGRSEGQNPKVTDLRSRLKNSPNRSQQDLFVLPPLVGRQSYSQTKRNGTSFPKELRERPANRRKQQKKPEQLSPLVYGTRLLILGIGLGVVVGTLLSMLTPGVQNSTAPTSAAESAQVATSPVVSSESPASPTPTNQTVLQPNQEITALKTEVAAVASQNQSLKPAIYIFDLETGGYVDLNGSSAIPSASTIKVPILVALFQDVDAGKIKLDQTLTLKPQHIASGSGNLQRKKPGGSYTTLEVATKMITISDNTATNMLIELLGGAEALNQRFQQWGLTNTVIRNRLPDGKGTNTTSPKELSLLMARVVQNDLLSPASRDRMIEIMRQTENNSLLPKGLGDDAKIAHKTGHLGSLVADVGIVDLPTGKRYTIAVLVQRSRNDQGAQVLIQKISQTAYQYFNKSANTPGNTPGMTPGMTPEITPGNTPVNSTDQKSHG